MGTTAFGFPFPEGGDLVIAGDDAMEALANALQSFLTPKFINTSGGSGAVPVGGWVTIQYAAHYYSAEFQTADQQTYTYNGPTRLFQLSAGAVLATTAAGNESSKDLRLLVNGASARDTSTLADRVGLHISYVGILTTGDTLAVQVGGGALASTLSAGYLCALAVPS